MLSEEKRRDSNRTKLNIANLCNNIKPGDITHEDVCHSFNDYFRKFNRSLKFYVQQDGCDVLQQLPGFVLKVSFDECKEHVLHGPILVKFKSLVGNYQLPKKIWQIFDAQDEDGYRIETLKLQRIFHLGQFDDDNTDWNDFKGAYACLLHIGDAKPSEPFEYLEKKVLQYLPPCDIAEDKIVSIVKMAVELAWKIVTLVPPALVCLPKEYNEDCMERRYTAWSDEAPSCPTIYFKPVLFYSALGHRHREIKGIVGNKINQNTMKIVKCKLVSDSCELRQQQQQVDGSTQDHLEEKNNCFNVSHEETSPTKEQQSYSQEMIESPNSELITGIDMVGQFPCGSGMHRSSIYNMDKREETFVDINTSPLECDLSPGNKTETSNLTFHRKNSLKEEPNAIIQAKDFIVSLSQPSTVITEQPRPQVTNLKRDRDERPIDNTRKWSNIEYESLFYDCPRCKKLYLSDTHHECISVVDTRNYNESNIEITTHQRQRRQRQSKWFRNFSCFGGSTK